MLDVLMTRFIISPFSPIFISCTLINNCRLSTTLCLIVMACAFAIREENFDEVSVV